MRVSQITILEVIELLLKIENKGYNIMYDYNQDYFSFEINDKKGNTIIKRNIQGDTYIRHVEQTISELQDLAL